MTPIIIGIAAGLVAGLVLGGSLRRLAEVRVRWVWLLLPGVVLQDVGGMAGIVAAYACLAAFVVRNIRWRGMGVILVGIALNLTPIVLDGGMPVEANGIVAAHIAAPADVGDLVISGKRHLATDGDHLRAFDDHIPDRWTHEVLSWGDLVIAVGIAAVLAAMLRDRARHG